MDLCNFECTKIPVKAKVGLDDYTLTECFK